MHGWGHNLQIANNRVNNNAGTLSGGINVGQGEFPDAYLAGATPPTRIQAPARAATCAGLQLPVLLQHERERAQQLVTSNSSTGDELFSATPAGAGGISFCTGADYYKFNYNWVCGNLSTGDGGGFVTSASATTATSSTTRSCSIRARTRPSRPTAAESWSWARRDVDRRCGVECGPGLRADAGLRVGPQRRHRSRSVINANLIMGNAAESGSGGGMRLQDVNGTDVVSFPDEPATRWNIVTVTNNIIANNVAGWDGAGISLQDALNVNLINNTIMSNDTTASSGVLFNTLGAPIASSQGPTCTSNCGTTSAASAGRSGDAFRTARC